MKAIILVLSVMVASCSFVKEAPHSRGTTGYLDVETSKSGKLERIYLKPASLFDSDDSVSIFRMGLLWEAKMDNRVDFIFTLPIKWNDDFAKIQNQSGDLTISMDGRLVRLKSAKGSSSIKAKDMVLKTEYMAKYQFHGSKKLLRSMLDGKDVTVSITVLGKKYIGRFDINNKYRERYRENQHVAHNGVERFLKTVK